MARKLKDLEKMMSPESLDYARRLAKVMLEEMENRTPDEEERLQSLGVEAALAELDARARSLVD
jgi:hypothetical protein